jgi:hypothetical protein
VGEDNVLVREVSRRPKSNLGISRLTSEERSAKHVQKLFSSLFSLELALVQADHILPGVLKGFEEGFR